MERPTTAVVAFVKTPRFSPVKTRLAKRIGVAAAERFFDLSIGAIACTLQETQVLGLTPYWAVAEDHATNDHRWRRFPQITQGAGAFCERLHRVLAQLHPRHEGVIAIGGDSPQLQAAAPEAAAEFLRYRPKRRAYVIGRCHDGGFYLFGSNFPITLEAWRRVDLGGSTAADSLVSALDPDADALELPHQTDADVISDLPILLQELRRLSHMNDEQLALVDWLERQGFAQ